MQGQSASNAKGDPTESSQSTEPILTAYRIHPCPSAPIIPAPRERAWMDHTSDRFAYRCLPLLIANQSGWMILNTHRLRVVWNGGPGEHDLTVIDRGGPKGTPCPAQSHFGHGVLTFILNYLFRTPPGINLWARGPANYPKDGIAPLEGIIETDWSVATFTMNWKVTTVNLPIDFEPGEPICMILPIRRGEVESFHPRARDLSSDPELKKAFELWSQSRTQFNKNLKVPGSDAQNELWQKEYLQGFGPMGIKAPQHQSKLNVREFELPPQKKNEDGG
jgi:hypothetical protein